MPPSVILATLETHVQEGKVRTPDLGGASCTEAVGDNLCDILLR